MSDMNDADHEATEALYQKLVDVILADEGASDPNIALSALSHTLIVAARACRCPLERLLSVLVRMHAQTEALDDGAPVPFGKPHEC